jgi:signal transduction histidine kinase
MNVLLVDPDPADRARTCAVLREACGGPILESDGGLETAIPAGPLDLVVLEHRLAGGDGLGWLRRLRWQHPFVPALMVTGHGDEDAAAAALRAGVRDYIPKRCLERLADAVQAVLGPAVGGPAFATRCAASRRLEGLGALAGGLAHELNNVLTPIRLGADALRRVRDEEKRGRVLDAIVASVERGTGLLRQVLDLARGQEEPFRPVALGPLLGALAHLLGHGLAPAVRVVADVPADLYAVEGDETQLTQALLHLAVDARDAMTRGGLLTFRARNAARPGPHVLLDVSDTGAAAAADPDLFFPAGGVGLGLSAVRAVVLRHRGFVEVESRPGGGTTVRLGLPAAGGSDNGSLSPLTAVPAAPGAPLSEGQRKLILFVDDEPAIRDLGRLTLEANGYRPVLAADGAQALALFYHHHAELGAVVIDLNMPVMDGLAAIRAMRQADPDLLIVPTSGLPPCPPAFDGLRLDPCLLKPYAPAQLLQALGEVLRPA